MVPSSVAPTSSSRLRRTLAAALGHPAVRRLTTTHAVDDMSDALVNLSVVGSLFFSVSLEASRTRILLYLVLTAAPLALMAPLIGPALDRSRSGYRNVIAVSQLVRAGCALLLASSLLSLAFYPLVFGVLVSRKAYALAKTAMLTELVPDQRELAAASGHLARTGTIAGGLGTAVGGLLIATAGVAWLPVVGAGGYVVSAILSSRIPPSSSSTDPQPAFAVVRAETPVDVRRAVLAVSVIRGAAGALTFLLALSIKRGGGDEWIFAAALIAAGVGTFLGTVAAVWLRRHGSAERVLLATLIVPGAISAFGVLTIGSAAIVAIAFTIGLGGSVASRSMDSLYASVPARVRGRSIARSELRFQLANVAGAAAAVSVNPPPRLGFALVAVALLGGGFVVASRSRLSLRREAGRWLLGGEASEGSRPLPEALLHEASQLAERGEHAAAVAVADAAVRVSDARLGADVRGRPTDARLHWDALAELVDGVTMGEWQATAERSVIVIGAATGLVVEAADLAPPSVSPGAPSPELH